jgi:hypothetical protein
VVPLAGLIEDCPFHLRIVLKEAPTTEIIYEHNYLSGYRFVIAG